MSASKLCLTCKHWSPYPDIPALGTCTSLDRSMMVLVGDNWTKTSFRYGCVVHQAIEETQRYDATWCGATPEKVRQWLVEASKP